MCVIMIRTKLEIASRVNSIGGQIEVSATVTSVTLKSLRSGRNVLIICVSYVILAIPFAVHACTILSDTKIDILCLQETWLLDRDIAKLSNIHADYQFNGKSGVECHRTHSSWSAARWRCYSLA